MRSPRIDLAYAESIDSCWAVEDNQACFNNPRWIEEGWQRARTDNLKRKPDDLEEHWAAFDIDQKRNKADELLHGQVCLDHANHSKRLKTNMMIRGFARDDLKGPKRAPRTRRTRATASSAVAGRGSREQTPEVGRAASNVDSHVPEHNDDSLFLPESPTTPSANIPQNMDAGHANSSTSPSVTSQVTSVAETTLFSPSRGSSSSNSSTTVNTPEPLVPRQDEIRPVSRLGASKLEALMLRAHLKKSLQAGQHLQAAVYATELEHATTRRELASEQQSHGVTRQALAAEQQRSSGFENLGTDVLHDNATLREEAHVWRSKYEDLLRGVEAGRDLFSSLLPQ